MSDKSVSVLAVGSEILDGRAQDTNSRFIAAELAVSGIHIQQILICDDREEDIIKALKFLESSSSIVIVSGGLGPTSDDVTRQAVARYCDKSLMFSEEEFSHLKEFF
ncbi:MAG: competence/damage-inducible protein A, partial [SAR324 cluster bacterium]|nr:competence/damage-inducible protein A [SAR324 cluster bacterium]